MGECHQGPPQWFDAGQENGGATCRPAISPETYSCSFHPEIALKLKLMEIDKLRAKSKLVMQ